MKTETKEKLELRHLAPYLPYGLKLQIPKTLVCNLDLTFAEKRHVIEYNHLCELTPWIMFVFNYNGFFGNEAKPILRPLSDLTKDKSISSESVQRELTLLGYDVSILSFQWHEWLCENHYDVFGLIEKNLAIDINTIK